MTPRSSMRRVTSLSIGDAKAAILLDALRRCAPPVDRREEILDRLPYFKRWTEDEYGHALHALVELGAIHEDAFGRLVVEPGDERP